MLALLLGRRVDPLEQQVVKFWPRNPPERHDIVLVDDIRCRVTWARVKWQGNQWEIRSLRVKPSPSAR